MYYLFILIYSVCIIYFLFKKRNLDLYSIMFVGLFYYSLPLLLGQLTLSGVVADQEINVVVYIIFCFSFITSFLFMVRYDIKSKKNIVSNNTEKPDLINKKINFGTVITILIFLYGIIDFGIQDYLSASKSSDIGNLGLINISVILSMILLPVTFFYKKYYSSGILFLILFSIFIYGIRSYLVISVISVGFVMLKFKEILLIKKIHYFIGGFVFAFIMAVYKFIYQYIKVEEFSVVVQRVLNLEIEYIIDNMIGDPQAVIYNLNFTINNNIDLSNYFILHRIFSIVPGGGDFISYLSGESFPRFSNILNYTHYDNISWGLASSIYGEIIAISGYTGFVLTIILLNRLVYKFNLSLKKNGFNFNNLLLLSGFVYLLFYSHRLDITFALGLFKISFILILFFNYFILFKNKAK